MVDSENTRTARALPTDDPVLAMCRLWQTEYDRLEDHSVTASRFEQAWLDADDFARPGAEREHLAAAQVRDQLADDLDILARVIFKTAAQSVEGAAAKLAVAIRGEAPSLTEETTPWPYLRSVHDDLSRLIEPVMPTG